MNEGKRIHRITIRIDDDTMRRIDAITESGCSQSDVIRALLFDSLVRHESASALALDAVGLEHGEAVRSK